MTLPESSPHDSTHEIWESYRKKQQRKRLPVQIAILVGTMVFLFVLAIGIYIVLM